MRKISIAFDNAEYSALTVLARQHGGNLSAAVRSLLHRETVTKAITDSVSSVIATEVKAALMPLMETTDTIIKNQSDASVAIRNNFGVMLDAVNKKR